MSSVVVVELPAKAKTINKYLGRGYTVLASYGHVRDLPPKDGSVRPDEDFAMSWQVDSRAEKRMKEIAAALKGADHLYLATDPDREGEAISWHIEEVLRQRKALKGIDVKRVAFNEVTKQAVVEAFRHPRELDRELVEAYLARRALDYLVGFTLSPVLWRKLPGSRSAGRVQSVALRLVCEREDEIEAFKAREYWTVEAEFVTPAGERFTARLTHLDGKRLDKFDLATEAQARAAADKILHGERYTVRSVERKQVRRTPPPPFTTSTLQQEASRKLGLGASRTMRIAQHLYEGANIGGDTVGLITYMRTDGVTVSNEAIGAARRLIEQDHGKDYVPDEPRIYRTQAKNAQEAHEAIRPTDMFRRPKDMARYLDQESRALYELVWKRAVASQMATALIDQVGVDIAPSDGGVTLRATGSTIAFDGFLALYHEDEDDPEAEAEGGRLPPLEERQALTRDAVSPLQHFTQPPPRYTEASLVKKLEELGIGRPSTYASILQVLQDRNYVRLEKKRFTPEDRGRLVTAFLTSFFERYVQYGFTADLENKLDDISGGKIAWRKVLEEFWRDFNAAVLGTKDLKISEVITTLDEGLGRHFFPDDGTGRDARLCPVCALGRLGLKLGRFGAFIACSNYPNCRYTRPLGIEQKDGADGAELVSPRELGADPASGLPVTSAQGSLRHLCPARHGGNGGRGREAQALVAAQGHAARRHHARDGAQAPFAAARGGPASRRRRAHCRRHRPLRPLCALRQDLQIARRGRRRADGRPQPRREPPRRAAHGPRRRTPAAARRRQPSRGRRGDQSLSRPLRALCQSRRDQRHRAERHRSRGADARPGRAPPRRAGGAEAGEEEGGERGEGRRGEEKGGAEAGEEEGAGAGGCGLGPLS